MTLQLADESLKYLKGIVEDLMIQVEKFKVPMDFVVLEIKEAPLKHKEHMILLGRPFMAITKTVIDGHRGKLTMTILGEIVQLQAIASMPYPFANFPNQCSYVEYIYIYTYIWMCLILLLRAKMELTWKL